MTVNDQISRELALVEARQIAVTEAAKSAAAETGRLRDEHFCDLTYVVGAMNEAGEAFDRKHAA
jgi:hypothetical protein